MCGSHFAANYPQCILYSNVLSYGGAVEPSSTHPHTHPCSQIAYIKTYSSVIHKTCTVSVPVYIYICIAIYIYFLCSTNILHSIFSRNMHFENKTKKYKTHKKTKIIVVKYTYIVHIHTYIYRIF